MLHRRAEENNVAKQRSGSAQEGGRMKGDQYSRSMVSAKRSKSNGDGYRKDV